MQRIDLRDVQLEYEAHGDGSPILLVHAGVLADWFLPLALEPCLADHQVIRYHRVGYGGSSRPDGAVSIVDQAAQASELLSQLGVPRAHVVGHSSGANIAMQLALDAPDSVATLVVLEPATKPDVPSRAAFAGGAVSAAMRHAAAGQWAEAVDAFMTGVAFPGYDDLVNRKLPGALARAAQDAESFFTVELPSLGVWSFSETEACSIRQPVLSIVGADSAPMFRERHEILVSWIPQVEAVVVPNATHMLPLEQPSVLAEDLTGFFARHP